MRPATLVASAALALTLAACGGSADQPTATAPAPSSPPSVSPTSSPAASPSTAPYDQLIEISADGKKVTPAPGRVSVASGKRVRLVVTTSTDNVLHIHGVELEEPTKAGQPTTADFTVTDPGVYEVELHDPELLLTQLVVR